MFFHDYEFFSETLTKVILLISGHHVKRHMVSIYTITEGINFGHLFKENLPMTIFPL